jgi:hypothetical protein
LFIKIRAQVPLDSSFTTPGFYSTQGSSITASATQPDGKMIMAGNFMRYNDLPVTNLIRCRPMAVLTQLLTKLPKLMAWLI